MQMLSVSALKGEADIPIHAVVSANDPMRTKMTGLFRAIVGPMKHAGEMSDRPLTMALDLVVPAIPLVCTRPTV